MIDLTEIIEKHPSFEGIAPEQVRERAKDLTLLVNYFSKIIENAPDGIYITDGDANAVLINKAFEKISGLDRSLLLHRNHRDLEREGIIAKSCALEVLRQKRTFRGSSGSGRKQSGICCLYICRDM